MTLTILVTGGTGFFGRALLRYLLTSDKFTNTTVSVLSRDPQGFKDTHPELTGDVRINFIEADIQHRDSLPWDQSFTHVLHAATESTIGPKLSPLRQFNQIVNGTSNILELAVATGARRFLLTSSGGIYGPQPAELDALREDWPGSLPLDLASSAYSQAKRAAEHLCTLYRDAHGLQTVVARCFAFVGIDLPLDVHFAIGNFIRDALYGEMITVAGDGTPLRTYLDQRDLADWLWTLLQQGHDGEAYNVGSDQVISIAELAHLVRDLIAPQKPVQILGVPDHTAARNRYVPDISKIEAMHGLRPQIFLKNAILDIAESHLR
jgi:UDP-glucuronate decarboxylase